MDVRSDSRRELLARSLLAIGVIAFIASRFWALALTPWEWDEILFISAMGDYDLSFDKPHPPGYPLFVAAAHLFEPLVEDPFRSLQAVSLTGACLLPVALWFLLLRLGFSRFVRVGAILVTVFTPVIWFYGGTAFSDVAGLAVSLWAAWGLLTIEDDRFRPFLAGALIALTIGFRPQNGLILLPFLLIVSYRTRRRPLRIATVMLTAAVLTIGTYGIAIAVSAGMEQFLRAIVGQAEYLVTVDSVNSSVRPGLDEIWEDFLLDPYPTDAIAWAILAIGLPGLVHGLRTKTRETGLLLSAFGPLIIVSILMFDYQAAERYSVPYLVLFSVLWALGVDWIASLIQSRSFADKLRYALLAITVVALAWRATFAISIVRESPTPPMAAIEYVDEHLREGNLVVIDGVLSPFAREYFADYQLLDEFSGSAQDGFAIGARPVLSENLTHYRYENETLWRIARRRYFDVWVVELDSMPVFSGGWYDVEWDGKTRTSWRWMGPAATIRFPGDSEPRCAAMDLKIPEGGDLEAVREDGGEVRIERDGENVGITVPIDACESCLVTVSLVAENPFIPGGGDSRELGAMLTRAEISACE